MKKLGVQIDIKGLGKSFKDRKLFTDVSYTFRDGEVNVILGESGSGKTTLLNILALYEPPDAGTVLYEGRQVSGLRAAQTRKIIREKVGFIYQDIRLFDELSVNENLRLALRFSTVGRKEWQSAIDELLERLGLEEYRDKLAGELSGGEKQRIAIARAVVSRKKLLLADEPTGALDEENAHKVTNLMRSLTEENGCTVIMVTHSMAVADEFPDKCWLRNGSLHMDKGGQREG